MFSGLIKAAGLVMTWGKPREEIMLPIMKKAAWLIAATVLLGGLSFAERRDDDNRGDNYWHDRRHDGDRNRDDRRWRDRDYVRRNDHDRDDRRWNDRNRDDRYRNPRGYDNWGYGNRNRGWGAGDRDADDGYYRRGNYGYYGYPGGSYGNGNYGYGNGRGNNGYNFGYQDGAMVARQDVSQGKPYHPDPRGKYEDADHGYYSGVGNKSLYRAQYGDGYRQGYIAAYRDRY